MEMGTCELSPTIVECKTEPTEEEEVANLNYKSQVEPEVNEILPSASSDPGCDEPPDPIEMVCIKMEPLHEQESAPIARTSPDRPFPNSPVEDHERNPEGKHGKQKRLPPIDPTMAGFKVVEGHKYYMCKICPYNTAYMCSLRKHIVTHTGEKAFRCGECSSAFTQASNLKIHMMKHRGEKPFKCELCPYSSNEAGSLKRHSRKHTGERPFSCGVCSNTFGDSSTLRQHMTTHSRLKTYHCKICPASFSQPDELKAHKSTHTVDKRFECDSCCYKCAKKSDLTRHIMGKHEGFRPFSCAHCQHRTASKSDLTKHLARKHSCTNFESVNALT